VTFTCVSKTPTLKTEECALKCGIATLVTGLFSLDVLFTNQQLGRLGAFQVVGLEFFALQVA
jgi:hypothetical protein